MSGDERVVSADDLADLVELLGRLHDGGEVALEGHVVVESLLELLLHA